MVGREKSDGRRVILLAELGYSITQPVPEEIKTVPSFLTSPFDYRVAGA